MAPLRRSNKDRDDSETITVPLITPCALTPEAAVRFHPKISNPAAKLKSLRTLCGRICIHGMVYGQHFNCLFDFDSALKGTNPLRRLVTETAASGSTLYPAYISGYPDGSFRLAALSPGRKEWSCLTGFETGTGAALAANASAGENSMV